MPRFAIKTPSLSSLDIKYLYTRFWRAKYYLDKAEVLMYKSVQLLRASASLTVLFFLGLSSFLQLAWARSLSVSLNMSLTRTEVADKNSSVPSKLSQEMLRTCMRETDVSMSQLKLFRLSLLSNDYNNNDNAMGASNGGSDGNNMVNMDYGGSQQLSFFDLKHNEPLQCFVRCLYDKLGLVKYEMLLEDAFKTQVQNIAEHEKPEIRECMDLQSRNRCEAAYKLHLCYNHLKTLEAEQRIREVLERSEVSEQEGEADNAMKENEVPTSNDDDDVGEVIIDGVKHSEENQKNY
ncbi:uncharacterized protein LOC115634303 [Scaptodrosophila lebanonensis]|uniref:Uncharacterized protein LOC115634303 n=1 Tax=Drosophila lebanonensis TaxID=7225 RepID=A0A6J2UI43_DROLE|nr:uncharacterized protein LOC115634303 [Scaptodrosophila lebanonensis]